ncbi:MAG TPA: glycosyltransferase family 25 protein [Mycobacterium sp.]|nr:glycosyltransferase family 25 protein [Mycobacterium sp.]HQE16427.1 glycosyltransferase family 25 protein [Mycobacterium sp.]
MRVHAINLDRDTDRWERFMRLNGDVVDVVRVPAVDGQAIDRAALTEHEFIVEPCHRTPGALGCACSHFALWFRAVDSGETLTVVEDDAILAGIFGTEAERVIDGLPPGWDLVLWGWNFDGYLWAEIPEGVSVCRLTFDQEEMRKHIDVFRADNRPRTAVRLRHGFGTLAYTITPTGAAAMLEACLPMTDRLVTFRGVAVEDFLYPNLTNDVDMNRAYPDVRAYACMPPLALSENWRETSHTRRRDDL